MGIVIVVRRWVKKLRREDMTGLFLASCKQLFIAQKSRPGGRGANKQHIEKLVARNSCTFQWRGFLWLLVILLPYSYPPLTRPLTYPIFIKSLLKSNPSSPRTFFISSYFSQKDIYKQESGGPQEVHGRHEENDN